MIPWLICDCVSVECLFISAMPASDWGICMFRVIRFCAFVVLFFYVLSFPGVFFIFLSDNDCMIAGVCVSAFEWCECVCTLSLNGVNVSVCVCVHNPGALHGVSTC